MIEQEVIMMFQKSLNGAGALSNDGRALTSDMSQIETEHSFDRLRRRTAARKNRSTANSGMFCRRSQIYRHA